MILRVASALLLASQLILIWLVFDLTGRAAIVYSFAGHPILAVGLVLAFVSLWPEKDRRSAVAPDPRTRPPG